jgi:hypothetical protein
LNIGKNLDIEIVLKSLKENRFNLVEFVEDANIVTKLVLDMIPLKASVGVPGSVTVRQIGLVAQLKARGTSVIDVTAPSNFAFEELARQALHADILLTSSNAITLDGKLVNIDGTGNRVAGIAFGPKRVILVIGTNKIVRDVEEAIWRIKNVIAPYHGRARGKKTPCAINGYCTDCSSSERMCNITTIIEKRPSFSDITILLVGKDLGLGWNPSWSRERIERIAATYREARKGFSEYAQRIPIEN